MTRPNLTESKEDSQGDWGYFCDPGYPDAKNQTSLPRGNESSADRNENNNDRKHKTKH